MKRLNLLLIFAIIPLLFSSCNNNSITNSQNASENNSVLFSNDILFSVPQEDKVKTIIPQDTVEIEVDFGISNKTITDKSIIDKITGILNGYEYIAASKDDEFNLQASSNFGTTLTLDGNEENRFTLFNIFNRKKVIIFSDEYQRKYNLSKVCYISDSMYDEIMNLLK